MNLVLRNITGAELARQLKVTRQAITFWKTRGKIPAERVLAVEAASGVSRSVLRPDLYPPDERRQGAPD
jgi:DNA-binding transcriptional regulator YdaS (Cro superfamily)